jgi:hypothetical protein
MFFKTCNACGKKLVTRKERFTKTCNDCALRTHEGFELMGKGKFKEGLKLVLNVKFGSDEEGKKVAELKMKSALEKKGSAIRKKLEKKGLSPEEIEGGLKAWEEKE